MVKFRLSFSFSFFQIFDLFEREAKGKCQPPKEGKVDVDSLEEGENLLFCL